MDGHILFQARDIKILVGKGADPSALKLLHETVWGTPGGIRYQKITSTETEDYFKNSWFLKLMKGSQLLGIVGMVHRRYIIKGQPLNTFYLRSFSFHSQYQVKVKADKNPSKKHKKQGNQLIRRIISQFFEKGEFFKNQFPGEAILFYGYVIANNERSARLSRDIGFSPFRTFSTMLYSKRFPKKHPQVELTAWEEIQNLVKEQYQNYPLGPQDRVGEEDDFFVFREDGQIVAGIRTRQVGWHIKEVPGFSGKIMMNVLPRLPIISTMFRPKNFRFLGVDSMFHLPNHEDKLNVLLRSACAHFENFIAMMWLDEKSKLYQTVGQNISMGLIHKLSRNTDQVNVIGRFINTPEDIKEVIFKNPAYVAMDEVT